MNQVISLRILALQALGFSLPDAMDAVLGAGTYRRIAYDLYEQLRAKAQG